jgi:hypothetical protein
MPVVAVEEEGEFLGTLLGVEVGTSISPFAQACLDEALSLAIGFGGVWPGADVLEAKPSAGVAEGKRSVAGAVVGHDAFDGDAEAGIVGDGGLEEGHGTSLSLVRLDLAEGQARGVVDADMDELPADATGVALALAVAGDAVADLIELPSFLMSMWIISPGRSRS